MVVFGNEGAVGAVAVAGVGVGVAVAPAGDGGTRLSDEVDADGASSLAVEQNQQLLVNTSSKLWNILYLT